jgi:uncharacterized membrane protein
MTAWGHRLSLGGALGLIAVWIFWIAVFASYPPEARTPVLAVSTLPLLLNLRGLMHDRRESYQWLGLLSLGYFIHGVGAASNLSERPIALVETGLALLLFAGSLLRLRSR